MHNLFCVHKCGYLLIYIKLSANSVTSWCPFPFYCVFQLHLFTQLPCSEERVRASCGGPCCLGEWKADLQECAGRWRYPIPGAEWSQATFKFCFHKRWVVRTLTSSPFCKVSKARWYGQTVARFRVLLKPIEIYAILPLCHPQCSLLFSLRPQWQIFLMMPLTDPGSFSQERSAPSIQHLSHSPHPHVLPQGCLGWPCYPSAPTALPF